MTYPILESIIKLPVFFSFQHIFALLPEFFLTLGTISLLLYGAFKYTDKKKTEYAISITYYFITLLAITAILLILNPYNSGEGKLIFNQLLIIDFYSFFIKLVILLGTIIILYTSISYIKKENVGNFEYPLLIGFAVIALLFLVSSFDTFAMYMSIELLSLSLYILAAFKTDSMYAAEAGVKYITLGALSSGILLFGMTMVYGNVITMDFLRLKVFLMQFSGDGIHNLNIGLIIGIMSIIIGFLFKISAVPFHMWTPDVYEGAPTPVTFFFASIVKFGIFAFFLRLCFYLFSSITPVWQQAILVTGVLSILIGCFGALFQRRIKRFAAYSSINHAGYLLLGVATGTFEGAQSVIFYLMLYVIMNIALFTFLLSCQNSETGRRITYLSDLAGLGKSYPYLAFLFVITMLSMAGIPPLAGFFSKYYLFLSLIHSSFYKVALLAIVTSVISTFYYIRLVKITFFEVPKQEFIIDAIDNSKQYVLSVCFIIITLFFLYPSFLITLSQELTHSLLFTFSYSLLY